MDSLLPSPKSKPGTNLPTFVLTHCMIMIIRHQRWQLSLLSFSPSSFPTQGLFSPVIISTFDRSWRIKKEKMSFSFFFMASSQFLSTLLSEWPREPHPGQKQPPQRRKSTAQLAISRREIFPSSFFRFAALLLLCRSGWLVDSRR